MAFRDIFHRNDFFESASVTATNCRERRATSSLHLMEARSGETTGAPTTFSEPSQKNSADEYDEQENHQDTQSKNFHGKSSQNSINH